MCILRILVYRAVRIYVDVVPAVVCLKKIDDFVPQALVQIAARKHSIYNYHLRINSYLYFWR